MNKIEISNAACRRLCELGAEHDWTEGPEQVILVDDEVYDYLVNKAINEKLTFSDVILKYGPNRK